MQRSALCRSRRELSNEYLLAKIGVDTAENEPLEVWGKIIQYYSFVSLILSLLKNVARAHPAEKFNAPLGQNRGTSAVAELHLPAKQRA